MRRQLLAVTLAGLALAITADGASGSASDDRLIGAAAPRAAGRVSFVLPPLRDEAAMVLVGTALIGLGAAVRRAA
jgi:hypothetical protein